MAVPRGIEVLRMRAAVHENLAVAVNVAFVKNEVMSRSLYQAPGIGGAARDAEGKAERLGIVRGAALFENLLCGGEHDDGIARLQSFGDIPRVAAAAHPDAGKVGDAIGQM
jgi:hypothetical protein